MFKFLSSCYRASSINKISRTLQGDKFGRIICQKQSKSAVRPLHVSSARNVPATGLGFHKPTDFEKKILVWSKMYPNVNSIPEEITVTKIKKAKDLMRIRVSLMMMAGTMALCVVFIWSGKRAVKRGESITQQNEDRHAKSKN